LKTFKKQIMRVELLTPDIEAKVGKRLEAFEHIYRNKRGVYSGLLLLQPLSFYLYRGRRI
jgi:hypothetical protein